MVSEFTEEYLEALYTLSKRKEPIKTTEIAKALALSPASVTEMVQRLSEKGYLEYKKYYGVRLTEEGLKLATTMKRRHRLLERFLADILGIKGEKVHAEACRLEHAVSPEVEEILCRILDHPRECPDDREAIPPCEKGFASCPHCGPGSIVPLSALVAGERGTVRLVVEDHLARDEISALGIVPGKKIMVESASPFRFTMGKKKVSLDLPLARKILVERS